MKRIPLTQGKFAIVDDEDYEELSKYKWCAHKIGNNFYAVRGIGGRNNHKTILMHRQIMGATKGQEIDHQSGNSLNNQKDNLRFCTQSQNLGNSKVHKNSTSCFKGVSWFKRDNNWRSRICNKHLGYFGDEIEAAKAYDEAAKKVYGEFARTNF